MDEPRRLRRREFPALGGGTEPEGIAALSATARRRGAGKRWDVPASPAVPDVVKPAKAKKPAKPAPQPKTQADPHEAGGVEAVKRRLNRLALDVHDGPMQNLAVIGFSLGDLRRKMHAL